MVEIVHRPYAKAFEAFATARPEVLCLSADLTSSCEVDGFRDRTGRITDHLDRGRIADVLGIDALDAKHDRAMICGSPSMLADFRAILDARGFNASPRIGTAGEYVFERAFVEK